MRKVLTDTTTSVVRAELLRSSQQLGGLTAGVVLNLIIMTDESAQYDAVSAASQAGREHPCRVLVVIPRNHRPASKLDAQITVGEEASGQTVVLRMHGELVSHADSVVTSLLMPDTPVVVWWPGAAPQSPATDSVGLLAQRRITDSAACDMPRSTLARLATAYRPGDTDLAWARLTGWRSLLAASLDRPHGEIITAEVSAEEPNPSADLMVSWLSVRLGIPVSRIVSAGPGITRVSVLTDNGEIALVRRDGRDATLSRPGEPVRHVGLHRRDTAELLAEELRRLDPDEVYGECLKALEGGAGREQGHQRSASPDSPR